MDLISLMFALGVAAYGLFWVGAVIYYGLSDLMWDLARTRENKKARANPPQPLPDYDPDSWHESVLSTLSPSMRAEFLSLDDPQRSSQITPLVKSAARRSNSSSSSRQSL